MFDGKPMTSRMKYARNMIAERTLTRGRRTTKEEALANVRAFLSEGESLGADFEKVWDDNVDKLYES